MASVAKVMRREWIREDVLSSRGTGFEEEPESEQAGGAVVTADQNLLHLMVSTSPFSKCFLYNILFHA